MSTSPARLASLFLLTIPLLGQIGGGSLVGNVTDPSGSPVSAAKVTAVNTETGVNRSTETNETGYFEFPLLPAGQYRLEAELTGFRRATTATFPINTGTRPRVDLKLELGQVSESVEVLATAPIVNATTTDLGVAMEKVKIESLPLNGRNFQQLVGLQAGVLSNPGSSAGGRGGIEFHGATAFGNNLLLDGVDMSLGEVPGTGNATGGGPLINTISVEAIEEFKASGNAMSAEFGRSIGGVLNVTTKSGTNQFHGALFHFFRNDKLDANSFFNNRSNLAKPALRWNQYGGNVGGPVLKNRAFFFFNYEGAQVRSPSQITGNVATPALISQLKPSLQNIFNTLSPKEYEPTTNPLVGFHRRNDRRVNDENTYLTRGDIDLSRHRLTLRYSYNNQDIISPQFMPSLRQALPTRFHNAVVQDNWTITPRVFNELRLGFNRTDLFRFEAGRENVPAWITTGGINVNLSLAGYLHFIPTTYSLNDNISLIRGKHSIKAGVDIRVNMYNRDQGGQPTHMYNSVNDLIADQPNRVRMLFGGGKGLKNSLYGFYVQDDWRVSARLQLNLGLRYDYFPPLKGLFNISGSDPFGPFLATNREPMYVADRNNFGPRIGLVYDPLGTQKLVFRAGAAVGVIPQVPIYLMDMASIDPRLPLVADFAPADIPMFPSAFPFPTNLVNQIAGNTSLLPRNFVATRQIMDYNRRDSYGAQWNFSVQTSVTKSLALQASYVGTRNVKLTSPRNVNLVDPSLGGRRPRPEFGDVNILENAANISYHGLQLSANQRLFKGLTFDAYYTWSKSTAYYVPDGTITFTLGSLQDPNNIAGSRGVKDGDLRHRFVGTFSYQVPTPPFASNALLKGIFGGWNAQVITSQRSGTPINVTSGVLLYPNGRVDGQRPDLVASGDPYSRNPQALTWLSRGAFDNATPQAQRRFGNLGYNALRGPSGFTFDGALHKQFLIHETHRITFRLEAFNALNHKILNNPVAAVSNPNFGLITGASGGRNIQLALKYNF
ncbi:MAG: TonB-dependent receptor [Bryobacterales bacterium]|nr:TonB-dependent receptor [Bryobacterales bacterium]